MAELKKIAQVLYDNGFRTLPDDDIFTWNALKAELEQIEYKLTKENEHRLYKVRNSTYHVGMVIPTKTRVCFSDGFIDGPTAQRKFRRAYKCRRVEKAKLVSYLVSDDSIEKFAIGITSVSVSELCKALRNRMTSGAKSYKARGYTHMLAFDVQPDVHSAHDLEYDLHAKLANHTKWDKNVHNTKGKIREDVPVAVYVVLIKH